jgi:hemerythrin-like domain-containing protein
MSELFPDPAPDFSDPLGMLRACHQRMLGQCELLEKLAAHIDKNGVDDDARKAARQVYRYFSTSAVFHHDDEEEDLFPKVGRSSLKMAEVVHQLRQEHENIDQLWKDLAPMIEQPANIGDTQLFNQLVNGFCEAYRKHIRFEEEEFLDRAQHMLSSQDLEKMGKSMKQRRERG